MYLSCGGLGGTYLGMIPETWERGLFIVTGITGVLCGVVSLISYLNLDRRPEYDDDDREPIFVGTVGCLGALLVCGWLTWVIVVSVAIED